MLSACSDNPPACQRAQPDNSVSASVCTTDAQRTSASVSAAAALPGAAGRSHVADGVAISGVRNAPVSDLSASSATTATIPITTPNHHGNDTLFIPFDLDLDLDTNLKTMAVSSAISNTVSDTMISPAISVWVDPLNRIMSSSSPYAEQYLPLSAPSTTYPFMMSMSSTLPSIPSDTNPFGSSHTSTLLPPTSQKSHFTANQDIHVTAYQDAQVSMNTHPTCVIMDPSRSGTHSASILSRDTSNHNQNLLSVLQKPWPSVSTSPCALDTPFMDIKPKPSLNATTSSASLSLGYKATGTGISSPVLSLPPSFFMSSLSHVTHPTLLRDTGTIHHDISIPKSHSMQMLNKITTTTTHMDTNIQPSLEITPSVSPISTPRVSRDPVSGIHDTDVPLHRDTISSSLLASKTRKHVPQSRRGYKRHCVSASVSSVSSIAPALDHGTNSHDTDTSPNPLDTPTPSVPYPHHHKRRRSQVKIACIHCKRACKKCDDARPCGRCVRVGLSDTCYDAPRRDRRRNSVSSVGTGSLIMTRGSTESMSTTPTSRIMTDTYHVDTELHDIDHSYTMSMTHSAPGSATSSTFALSSSSSCVSDTADLVLLGHSMHPYDARHVNSINGLDSPTMSDTTIDIDTETPFMPTTTHELIMHPTIPVSNTIMGLDTTSIISGYPHLDMNMSTQSHLLPQLTDTHLTTLFDHMPNTVSMLPDQSGYTTAPYMYSNHDDLVTMSTWMTGVHTHDGLGPMPGMLDTGVALPNGDQGIHLLMLNGTSGTMPPSSSSSSSSDYGINLIQSNTMS